MRNYRTRLLPQVIRMSRELRNTPTAPARCTWRSGSVSGACFAGADSPWPAPFPPPPPQSASRLLGSLWAHPWPYPQFPGSCPFRVHHGVRLVWGLPCSGASQVLRGCVTSRVRSSADCVLRLPAAAPALTVWGSHGISRFSRKVLPRMLGVYDRARSRYTSPFSVHRMSPSAPETDSAPGT